MFLNRDECISQKKFVFFSKIMSKKIVITKSWIITFIQVSMALIYILFWVLKLWGWSPSQELIYLSTSFIEFERFYPALWIWEVVLWFFFLHKKAFRKVWFWLFMVHMAGTFLPFFTTPELCFWVCEEGIAHPTFTMVGQYIVKNISLIACGLILKYSKTE